MRFECTGCGYCCTGEPGYVYIQRDEGRALADHLGVPVTEFYQRYVRRVPEGLSLLERPDGSCVFYDDGCTVYSARPRQCRTYPFWPEVLSSERNWKEESNRCPGIGSGRLYDFVTIESLRRGRGEASDPG